MENPGGPYPGRQLFLGLTSEQKPCFAYLVTGRSPESRQRKAVNVENSIRMGPLGDVTYDPLRHYTAVKYDNSSGVIAITNGIQTEAVFETYKLLYNVGTPATHDYMAKLMEGANFEPDTLHTPRIAAAIIPGQNGPVFIAGIKAAGAPAAAYQVSPAPGKMTGLSTYKGQLDTPEPTDPGARLNWIDFDGTSPQSLARHIYDISKAEYNGEDIRVCAIGGILSEGAWNTAVINHY